MYPFGTKPFSKPLIYYPRKNFIEILSKVKQFPSRKSFWKFTFRQMATLLFRLHWIYVSSFYMMTSSNGIIYRVTDPLCGEFTTQRTATRSSDVFFDLRMNKRLSKQSRGWWFETPLRSLWRHCNDQNFDHRCSNYIFILHWTFGFNILAKTTASRVEKHFIFGIWCALY